MREFSLQGKVAIVTGAGRGIGKGIALALAEAGADVVAAARTKEEIEQTADQIIDLGRRGHAVSTDVTRAGDVQALVDFTVSELGQIDILVSQAGSGGPAKPLVPLPGYSPPWASEISDYNEPISEEMWRVVIDTNLTSMFLCARAVGPHMLKRGKGKVINMGSFAGSKAYSSQIAYSTSKAGVTMFTKGLALEWARYGINVNAIGPGYIQTRMTERLFGNEEVRKRVVRAIPLNRLGTAREVGLLAVYLASEASDYMTGQTLYLDGGMLA